MADLNVATNIVESMQYLEGENVVEIGPGRGVLTEMLIKKPVNFKAIEADRDMVAHLVSAYPQIRDKIIQIDFLKADLSKVFDGESLKIIGNFPYNISSQIVFKMLKHFEIVSELVGMFQFEMAERIVADHGSKKYGVISVLTQALYDGEFLFEVPQHVFRPPPKVMSGVIRLTRKQNLIIDYDYPFFKHIVKTAFNQRRKMLRNTLKSIIEKTNFEDEELLMKRPEQLSVQEFINLSKKLNYESGK